MKKLMLFIAIIIASGTISTYANGEKVHLKLVFEAVDVQGNRDTAEFAIRDRATNGLDPELGEVNLYGVPPQGDLDIRLVQRKVEAIDEYSSWLRAESPLGFITFSDNIDLKKDYRSNVDLKTEDTRQFAIKIFAKYYPISVKILSISNYNSIEDFKYFSEIMISTFDETITDRMLYNSVIDNNDSNSCYFYHFLDKIDPAITYESNDTIYDFIAQPKLIEYSYSGRDFTFLDSTSRNYVLGGKFILAGMNGKVQEANNTIKLYPNPSNNNVIISEGNVGDTFEVVNSAGDKISNFAVEVFPYSYDVSALPAGVYYIINTTSGNGFGKFVKE